MKSKKLNLLILPASLLMAGLSSAATITFETGQGYTAGSLGVVNGGGTNAPFDGQQGWSRSTSNSSTGVIATTANSGEYAGGQALTSGGNISYIGGKLGIVATTGSNTISFDTFGNNAVNIGYMGDANGDGLYSQTPDSGMQFGVAGGNAFVRRAEFGTVLTPPGLTTGVIASDKWYRWNIAIGEVVSGERSITMSVRNLTDGLALNLTGASPGNDFTFSVTSAAFGVAPEDAVGGFVRLTGENNFIDNLSFTAIPEPSSALLGGIGVLLLLRRRRA